MVERNQLPFREKTELFLVNTQGNILAEDHGTYIMFPGGGIDDNERDDRISSAIRELEEETHMTVNGVLVPQSTVSWVWFPEWANNAKRQQRYTKYQGERVHIFVGSAQPMMNTSQVSEDTWKDKDGIPPEECLKKLVEYAQKDHQNTYAYRIAQQSAIRAACILSGNPLYGSTDDMQ